MLPERQSMMVAGVTADSQSRVLTAHIVSHRNKVQSGVGETTNSLSLLQVLQFLQQVRPP